MLLNTSHPVTFIFTNSGTLQATGVQVVLPNLQGLTLQNGCRTTLAGGASCQVSGTYTSTTTGPATVEVTLSYSEGSDVTLNTITTVKQQQVAYVVNYGNSMVSACPINPDGTFGNCDPAGRSGFSNPQHIVLNAAGTWAYVTNYVANSNNNIMVSLCAVNGNGTFSSCSSTGLGFNYPSGIVLNAAGTRAYVTNTSGGTVSVCDVNTNSGQFSNCSQAGSGFNTPESIVLNAAGTRAYVTNPSSSGSSMVSVCAVDANSGQFSNCSQAGSGFNTPESIVLNAAGTRAYVTNSSASNSTVSLCTVDANSGQFSNCSQAGSGFSVPYGITLFPH
jgi:DNA-binding beta-propeller fold protein YncE